MIKIKTMIGLKDFIQESISVNEAAPQFTNDAEGIDAFCRYVFDENFCKWVVNPDLSITLIAKNAKPHFRFGTCYIDAKDLTEIPSFIKFSNIEKVQLGLRGSSKKLKTWAPNVIGHCSGIIISEINTKLETLDLTNCEMRNGSLWIEKTNVKTIVGCHGDGVSVFLKMNKNLESIDLKKLTNCVNPGSWIVSNKRLDIKPDQLPKGIRVEKNANKEKIYIS